MFAGRQSIVDCHMLDPDWEGRVHERGSGGLSGVG
jgi:hypothetical protein